MLTNFLFTAGVNMKFVDVLQKGSTVYHSTKWKNTGKSGFDLLSIKRWLSVVIGKTGETVGLT